MPYRNLLLEDMKNNRTSLGAYANDPDMIRLMAHVGFHWVMIDMMFTGNDWSRVENLITVAEASDITPVIRVQSNPWIGYDHRIAVDVTRALGVGAQFVIASVSGKREVEECIEASKDWHRRALTIHPFQNFSEWEPVSQKMAEETVFCPAIESKQAYEETEEILKIPGLKCFHIAMTDLSRVIRGKNEPDFYNDKLWDYVRNVVRICNERHIYVGANTSYAYTAEEMAKRVKKLHEAGIRMILVQGGTFLFQLLVGEFMKSLKKDLELE
jgi:2-keto-3-deoxy-L-rhamnonate aldolase RhmA